MLVQCPNCGKLVVVNGLGRKRLNIPLKIICEALEVYSSIEAARQKLNCSQGYIYNSLKAHGLKPKDLVNNHAEKG